MSALTPLGLNLSGLITQIISFVILFAILYKLLYQPVIAMLDQRSAKIKDNLDAAEKAKLDIAKSEQSIRYNATILAAWRNVGRRRASCRW